MINTPVYRNERRTLAWRGQSARPGRILIDVPEFVIERHGDQLVRIDEDGYVPRYDLQNMRLEDARAIAERAETDAVDAHSSREEIVEALSPDVSDARAALEAQAVDDEAGEEYEGEDDVDDEGDGDGDGDAEDEDDGDEDNSTVASWRKYEAESGQSAEEAAAALLSEADDRADDVSERARE